MTDTRHRVIDRPIKTRRHQSAGLQKCSMKAGQSLFALRLLCRLCYSQLTARISHSWLCRSSGTDFRAKRETARSLKTTKQPCHRQSFATWFTPEFLRNLLTDGKSGPCCLLLLLCCLLLQFILTAGLIKAAFLGGRGSKSENIADSN